MSDMIKGYDDAGVLQYAKVTDNYELAVTGGASAIANRDTLIAATVEINDGEHAHSAEINLDTLRFRREYRGLAIQTRFITLATGSSVITGSIDFYNTSAGTSLKTISSAFVLTAAAQVEVYNILPDDMTYNYMVVTYTESGGSAAHAHIESFLIY